MEHKENCLICGSPLEYLSETEEMECIYCHEKFQSQVKCGKGHFICDRCHSRDGIDFILTVCEKTEEKNPYKIAELLFRDPRIHMHGPEHHVLVPAVLIAAYYNNKECQNMKKDALQKAKERGSMVPGGFCGFAGTCGAGTGVGIFFSIIEESSPMDSENWGMVNRATGQALINIGKYNGPRCCKRNTFTAFRTAEEILEEREGMILSEKKHLCHWSSHNGECLKEKCGYYIDSYEKTNRNKTIYIEK